MTLPPLLLAGLAIAGLAMSALTVGGLMWRRSRRQAAEPPKPPPTTQLPPGVDYEALFTLSPHPMFVYDVPSLRILAVNGAMERRYGYTAEEFQKMALADIRLPEDVPAMQALAREARKQPSATVPGTWRHRSKDGSTFHVRVSGHDLAYGAHTARMVQVIDVSAEVALQAEREEMIAKLQQSREWLATALHAGRIALWERNLKSRTLVLDGRWADILGTTAAEVGPVTEQTFIDLCHPDDLPTVTERFKANLRHGDLPYADEFRLRHAQRGWIWVLAHGRVAERDARGRAVRVIGTYVDISELKAAQQARERQRAAEEASAMKSHFLGRVSHELRTPLNAVIGFSQLLQLDDTQPLTGPQRDRVGHIERAGQHLLSLITDLMDLSRIELGAVDLQTERLDVQRLLDECVTMVDTQRRERGLMLEAEPAAPLPHVLADALRLRQCLLNLLSNAVKYSDPKGTVRVGARTEGPGEVAVWVWNSGPGLTAEQLDRLYEPFNRLGREATHGEGTGIGLAISRQLIERMGGRIEVRSEAGAWAQFTVVLPAASR